MKRVTGNPNGLTERERICRLGNNCIPPDPSLHVATAFSPLPPKLSPLLSDAESARVLYNAWRSTLLKWRPKRAVIHSRAKAGLVESLVVAAHDLRDKDIAPLSWAEFSADCWSRLRATDGPPRLLWTYSATRREKHLAYFEDKREQYESRTALPNPVLRLLWDDWRSMWQDLLVETPFDVPSLARVVENWFPGRTYMDRLDTAKAAMKQIEFQAAILACEGRSLAWLP